MLCGLSIAKNSGVDMRKFRSISSDKQWWKGWRYIHVISSTIKCNSKHIVILCYIQPQPLCYIVLYLASTIMLHRAIFSPTIMLHCAIFSLNHYVTLCYIQPQPMFFLFLVQPAFYRSFHHAVSVKHLSILRNFCTLTPYDNECYEKTC